MQPASDLAGCFCVCMAVRLRVVSYDCPAYRQIAKVKKQPRGAGLSFAKLGNRLRDNFLDSIGVLHTNQLLVQSSIEE